MIVRASGIRYAQAVVNAFKEVLHNTTSDTVDHRDVTFGNLEAGMILATDLISKDGTLLLPANYVLTAGIVEKIKLFAKSHGGQMNLKIRNKEHTQ